MKKLTAFVLALACVLGLVGCNTESTKQNTDPKVNITGIVKDISDNAILIENETGEYWVSLNTENKDTSTTFNIGDEVVVCYDGTIAESYPMQIHTVYSITVKTPAGKNDTTVPEPESYAFEAQYIRTDGYSESRSYPYHVVINSKEELDAYYEANKNQFDLENREDIYIDTTIGFLEACEKYNDSYFEQHNLVLIVLEEGSGSIRHKITDVRPHRDENGASLGWDITINRIVPEAGTDDMAQWHLFLEVQMGSVIQSGDSVWINGTPSVSAANK